MIAGIGKTNFEFTGQTAFYRGKVRDVYTIGHRMVVVATDRISAFDVVLPKAIPYKGQVLNQLAAHFLQATSHLVPNWLQATPNPNVSVGLTCQPFPVEMVIRGYLAGHAWREYRAGKRSICGVPLPNGLKENDRLPQPIITPTTKAQEGHDEDISRDAIIAQGLVSEAHYTQLEAYTRALFDFGTNYAAQQGLILVDTKYEFGLHNGTITLIDEVHTPDSSRYFYQAGYHERQQQGQPQEQLSKEFVRQWLIKHGFQGLTGQTIPEMTNEVVNTVSERYIELFEKVTGLPFQKATANNQLAQIEHDIADYLNTHKD